MNDPNRFCRVRVRDVEREVEAHHERRVMLTLSAATAIFLALLFAISAYCVLMGL